MNYEPNLGRLPVNPGTIASSEIEYERGAIMREPIPVNTSFSVSVEPLNIGFILRVGCQSIAVSTKEDLIKFLTAYYTDTDRVVDSYHSSDKTYKSLLEIVNQ